MRIAVFHNLPGGGGKRVLFEFARRLRERGHELDLYLFDTADERSFSMTDLARSVVRIDTGFRGPQKSQRGPLRNLRWWVGSYYRLERASRRIAERINAGGHDLAFVQQCRLSGGAPYLLRHLKLPSAFYCAEPRSVMERVARLAGAQPATRWRSRLGDGLRTAVLGTLERVNARAATGILTCSIFAAEAVRDAYGVPGRVVYPGVDAAVFRPVALDKENAVLSVGELIPRKGHALVVEAVGMIPTASRPRVIVSAHRGEPGERRRLETLAAARGVGLEIVAPEGDAALVELYNRCVVVACAHLQEPLGLVPLEAMSCGVPVVGVAEAGLRETISGDSGGILVGRDPTRLAEGIAALLADAGSRRRLGARGREYLVERWDWESATDNLAANLEALRRGRPGEIV